MRVIAGEYRSRALKSIPGLDTRPTPDRLREALFNVLAPRIDGVVFVDAYAGTGAVGIEALSRGAARAIFIERSGGALKVLRANLASLGALASAEIIASKVTTAIPRLTGGPLPVASDQFSDSGPVAGSGTRPDIFFLDPPYERENEYAACLDILGENPPALVIAQHASRFALAQRWGKLERVRLLKQGDNSLSFFEPGGVNVRADSVAVS